MKVFKFGGASVKSSQAVKNAAKIVQKYSGEKLWIVVSAMGKMTNAFEELLNLHWDRKPEVFDQLNEIKKFHQNICEELFHDKKHKIFSELHNTFVEAEWQLEDAPIGTYSFEYDQLIGLGELLSTKILSAYFNEVGLKSKWLDARDIIKTDNRYRKANIDWELTAEIANETNSKILEEIIVTQGFIGSSSENFTTSLGREGSDFSAAIIASVLDAEEVVIWKDVEGMLNADPKYYENTLKLENISYKEAVELSYFGASVIHPKTIKPLQNKSINLRVKSFIQPELSGTLINGNTSEDKRIPSYIHKENQILISISSKDYAFMDENRLANIFSTIDSFGLAVNIMQNSAISFSIVMDGRELRIGDLIEKLQEDYFVTYNNDATLITIRHFTEELIQQLIQNKEILMEQRTRNTARFVIA